MASMLPLVGIPIAFFVLAAPAPAAHPELPPLDQWRLDGRGRTVDDGLLEVSGNGDDSSAWRCDYPFTRGATYRIEMLVRRLQGQGTVVAGPEFANHDYLEVGSDWRWLGHVFRAPENVGKHSRVRLGQWHASGTIQFKAARVRTALPVYRQAGELTLGDGESIRKGIYRFAGVMDHPGGNDHRVLQWARAGFNSNRWCFGDGAQVEYRFGLPGLRFTRGSASVSVNYHVRGGCLVEASRDAKTWQTLGRADALGSRQFDLPDGWFPAAEIHLRLRAEGPSNFQIHRIDFEAALDRSVPDAEGETNYAELLSPSPDLVLRRISVSQGALSDAGRMRLELAAAKPLAVTLSGTVSTGDRASRPIAGRQIAMRARETSDVAVDLPGLSPGENEINLTAAAAGSEPCRLRLRIAVPEYYRADYGELLSDNESANLWWCEAAWKIPRQRALPTVRGTAVTLSAARRDREAAQIVVRPKRPLRGLRATPTPLIGPESATIPPSAIEILEVAYHRVDQPTDRTGVRDFWPDALPPLSQPIDLAAGQNQPLWIVVAVPADAVAGDYRGEIRLEAAGFSAAVPLRLHVWDFALPVQNHLETAFGLSTANAFRYHQAKSETQRRQILDAYLKIFSQHRISPYNLAPLDPIRVKFVPAANPPRAEVDFAAFDAAMSDAIARHHFTNFNLPLQGMGGGTYQSRHAPKILGFGEETPQYQAMFASYVQQLEGHLRDRGWLGMAYAYWFDEPEPKDYPFVRQGMERLKKYAPGLRRMLTEQPEEALAGAVDVWCPVSNNYDPATARQRMAAGDRFWWYVCCGPKAPFCTLFIDHPATDLRVWLWQTWQRGITGVLVWEATWWTSPTAFPNEPQDPYEDPMGYVSDGTMPKGTKRYWGNGDGRFFYPPRRASMPGKSGPDCVLDPPVSSIRGQMLREGIEDYEYLYLLRERLAAAGGKIAADQAASYAALLEVPAAIARDMTAYTKDPRPIYARRAAIAEAIEAVGRK